MGINLTQIVRCDRTSPLNKELQDHPWTSNYKPKIPCFDGQSNPRRFVTNYETTIISTGGDVVAFKVIHNDSGWLKSPKLVLVIE
jgi:hypothetical protein